MASLERRKETSKASLYKNRWTVCVYVSLHTANSFGPSAMKFGLDTPYDLRTMGVTMDRKGCTLRNVCHKRINFCLHFNAFQTFFLTRHEYFFQKFIVSAKSKILVNKASKLRERILRERSDRVAPQG